MKNILIFIILLSKQSENFTNFYTINNVVDKLYVINLDSQKERLKTVSKKLNNLNIKFQRYSAINGRKIYKLYKDKTTLEPGTL